MQREEIAFCPGSLVSEALRLECSMEETSEADFPSTDVVDSFLLQQQSRQMRNEATQSFIS